MTETSNERFRDTRLSFKPKPSQSRFAELLGISLATVQKIEQGEITISENVLRALENNLNVSSEYILKGKGSQFIKGGAPDLSLKAFAKKEESNYDYTIKHLEGEIAYYRQLLLQITGGKGFLQLINKKATLIHERLAPTGS